MLDRLQRGLERLYRIDTGAQVDDFLIDEHTRQAMSCARSPREQLLCTEIDGELQIGLFVCDRALDNLRANDPSDALGDHNLGDFLLAVEGVSHFVYLVWRAAADQAVSALELELQAEIDKYVTCLLTLDGDAATSDELRDRLFRRFVYEDDLDGEEQRRYQAANANALRYSASLERRFVRPRRIGDMLAELRRFYRMSLAGKLDFIQQAA